MNSSDIFFTVSRNYLYSIIVALQNNPKLNHIQNLSNKNYDES
jgi:hypothetical protein